jgi:SPP1 gp7 family putative phage head morphogenesis protein
VGKLAKIARPDEAPDAAERTAAENALLLIVAEFFRQQLGRLRDGAQEHGQNAAAALGALWQSEPALLTRALLPHYTKTLTTAADVAASTLGIGVDWELVNADVLTLARAEAARLAGQVTETTKAQAAKLITDWIETGGTMDELSERLAALYPEQRAKMIAATEVTRLYAAGNRAAWVASGVVSGLEWMTASDERVCPVCGALDGKQYSIEAPERMPPAHPSCRCWLAPVVMSAKELRER